MNALAVKKTDGNGNGMPTAGSFTEIMSMADVCFQSGLFKDVKSAAQAIVKIMKGRELGIPPASAMEIINVIEGKTALSGVAIAGIVKNSRKYQYRVLESTTSRASVEFFELVGGKWISQDVSTFTEEDARRAGLLAKKNWREYPQNMYLWRAMSNGGRMYCPDKLAGVYTPEELGAEVDEEGNAIVLPTGPGNGSVSQDGKMATLQESKVSGGISPPSSVTPALETPVSVTAETGGDDVQTGDRASQGPENASDAPPAVEISTIPKRTDWMLAMVRKLKPTLSPAQYGHLRAMWKDPSCGNESLTHCIREIAQKNGVMLEEEDS